MFAKLNSEDRKLHVWKENVFYRRLSFSIQWLFFRSYLGLVCEFILYFLCEIYLTSCRWSKGFEIIALCGAIGNDGR